MTMHFRRLPSALRSTLVAAGALSITACMDALPSTVSSAPERSDHQDPLPAASASESSAAARIDVNLAALAELELFEVGALLTDSPRSGGNCYGYPCEGERALIESRLATELETLAALAQDLPAGTAHCDTAQLDARAEAHLALLDGLDIVEVGEFLRVTPASQPHCYNLPCPEDIAAAEAINCEKLGRLQTLAERAAFEFGVADAPSSDGSRHR